MRKFIQTKKSLVFLILNILIVNNLFAQLKFLIEDFEGLSYGILNQKNQGIYSYGDATLKVCEANAKTYSGKMFLEVQHNSSLEGKGWGIGIGLFVDLNPDVDYLNFYFKQKHFLNKTETIKISINDDDDFNGKYEEKKDDQWIYFFDTYLDNNWHLVSIPLKSFIDKNIAGDKLFNIGHSGGKLLELNFAFQTSKNSLKNIDYQFDFLCFSKGKLPVSDHIFEPFLATKQDYCRLGSWTEQGRFGNFFNIASSFESYFSKNHHRKLDVVHFFHAFSVSHGYISSNLIQTKLLKDLIKQGYLPFITLETKFVNEGKNFLQPDLKDIISGKFDFLFKKWAKAIKDAQGNVLIRIFHEFNGDWYPWSICNNDKNPLLLKQAYVHIHQIFQKEGAFNAKFIWCPNSISKPQAPWNNIIDAYPGDNYVDYVGLDVYNGAGKESFSIWRSFRKEASYNYFVLTNNFPSKPLLICETACRERFNYEGKFIENKSQWIINMSKALQSDFNKVRLLCWFDEGKDFRLNSSTESLSGFFNSIWINNYFRSHP